MRCFSIPMIRVYRRTFCVIMSTTPQIRHDDENRWPNVEATVAFFARQGILVDPKEVAYEISAEIVKKVDDLLACAHARHYQDSPYTLEALIQCELAPMDVHIG